ncbi:hypothetical protein [Thiomonas arsenitoxydans]|jgi:hypothetical protein|uniref:hypothetical protein n=1 Tax=Thiomonas arsenitoxydans (strain DSM 22701 / CIP 110005 / 3As) TaxID=426114 RepID=UPI0023F0F297|nr:hypothetical protein [Thiomonas arsenitoxydans]
MKPKGIDKRILECVKASEESRRRAGRPPHRREILVERCRRQIAQQDQMGDEIAGLIELTRRVAEVFGDLTDIEESWIELEDFAACVHDGDDPHYLASRRLTDAVLGARRDPNVLLRLLGLVQQQGGAHAGNATQHLLWGRLLYRLEDKMGIGSDAMEAVQEACEYQYSESTLRKWRDDYRKSVEVSNGE